MLAVVGSARVAAMSRSPHRLPKIEERMPPATTPERPSPGPRSAYDWLLVFTGVAWAREVRRSAARRRRSKWDRARDGWALVSFAIALPTAWLLGHVVLWSGSQPIAEGVVFVPASRGESGSAANPARAREATARWVGTEAASQTTRGTVLGTFLIEQTSDFGGWPFAGRVRVRSPQLLLYDHASGRDGPVLDPLGHAYLPLITDAIKRLGSVDRKDAELIDSSTKLLQALADGDTPAREPFRTEAGGLAADTLIAGTLLLLGGSVAISLMQLLLWLGSGSAEARRERLRGRGLCPRCGHDVRGSVLSAQCPECGELLY